MADNKTLLTIVVAAVAGVALYMYFNKPVPTLIAVNANPMNEHGHKLGHHVVHVKSVPIMPVHSEEDFAFSDIKNTYVNGGDSALQLATDSYSQNIGGILANPRNADGQVINVGMNLLNEFALQQRDNRVIESYIMNEHQYGAGTPNYRKLAGWY